VSAPRRSQEDASARRGATVLWPRSSERSAHGREAAVGNLISDRSECGPRAGVRHRGSLERAGGVCRARALRSSPGGSRPLTRPRLAILRALRSALRPPLRRAGRRVRFRDGSSGRSTRRRGAVNRGQRRMIDDDVAMQRVSIT
jgi:hypothetical protein